ncbi:MAG: methionyl-tRNA formyltransferase [Bacteroidales bacterium]|nr:methionyl-tRNA formyltransferase [Bacteroidales bacterium]
MSSFPRIVFFGTPDFAVASLEHLVSAGFSIVAVVTAPDKPAGRGLQEKTSPVKEFALKHGIPLLQPVNMKDPGFISHLQSCQPDLQIVIAFRMIPRQVWELPPSGTFNLHASLLPQYRGAAPINRAIINGEQETGVTTFFLNEHIDTGKIIFSERVAIGPNETAGELHDRLMIKGAALVLKTVEGIVAGSIKEISQESLIGDSATLKQAPKIFKEDCRIDWSQDVLTVHNFIRGLSPHPGAFTTLKLSGSGIQNLKIFRAYPEPIDFRGSPGNFFTDGKSFLKVGAKNGFIHLEELQLSGRKVMSTGDFLRGFGRIFPETPAI